MGAVEFYKLSKYKNLEIDFENSIRMLYLNTTAVPVVPRALGMIYTETQINRIPGNQSLTATRSVRFLILSKLSRSNLFNNLLRKKITSGFR